MSLKAITEPTPSATRRAVLAGLAAGAVPIAAIPAFAATAATPDPALDLITRCRSADADYNRRSKGLPANFDYDALISETWGPVFPLLHEAPDATTAEGAIAMLDHVLDAHLAMEPGDAMIESALAYLRSAAGRIGA